MNQDSGIPLTSLKVDGGMTANSLLMQTQANLLGIPVGKVPLFQIIVNSVKVVKKNVKVLNYR